MVFTKYKIQYIFVLKSIHKSVQLFANYLCFFTCFATYMIRRKESLCIILNICIILWKKVTYLPSLTGHIGTGEKEESTLEEAREFDAIYVWCCCYCSCKNGCQGLESQRNFWKPRKSLRFTKPEVGLVYTWNATVTGDVFPSVQWSTFPRGSS